MIYDAIIIGGGPAGLASALYLLRDGRKVLIIEKETIGGTAASTPLIENYPGFKAISGSDLTSAMFDQVDELGVDFEIEEVIDINVDGDIKEVITEDNTSLLPFIFITPVSIPQMGGSHAHAYSFLHKILKAEREGMYYVCNRRNSGPWLP